MKVCPVLLGLMLVLPATKEEEQDLLELVSAGNQAARHSIRTFSCHVEVAHNPAGKFPSPSGDYWRSSDAVRVRWSSYGVRRDTLLRDYRTTTVTKNHTRSGRERNAVILNRANGLPLCECDVWSLGLIQLPDPGTGALVPFDEVLKKYEVDEVVREGDRDREIVSVTLSHDNSYMTIHFDPQANYLIRRRVITSRPQQKNQSKGRSEVEVARFKEVIPAVFVPERVVGRYYLDDRLIMSQDITFSNIRVNQSLPSDLFQIRMPPGSEVFDHIQGQEYRVDTEGNVIGSPRPLAQVPPVTAARAKQTETLEERFSLTRLILPTSLGLLGLGIGLHVLRKWRRRNTISESG